jgi:hypothetical protein
MFGMAALRLAMPPDSRVRFVARTRLAAAFGASPAAASGDDEEDR